MKDRPYEVNYHRPVWWGYLVRWPFKRSHKGNSIVFTCSKNGARSKKKSPLQGVCTHPLLWPPRCPTNIRIHSSRPHWLYWILCLIDLQLLFVIGLKEERELFSQNDCQHTWRLLDIWHCLKKPTQPRAAIKKNPTSTARKSQHNGASLFKENLTITAFWRD